MESGEKVALYVHSLEEKIFNLEQRNKVLEELLAKLKRDNSVPPWQPHPSGGFTPAIRFEHVEASRPLCETFFGYPGPVIRELHNLLEFNGLLSASSGA